MKMLNLLMVPIVCFGVEFEDVFEKALQNSSLIGAKHKKILASRYEADAGSNYKNPVLTVGANDLLLNGDFLKRDREPMQTQYIGITQEVETFGKLELKEAILRIDTLVLEYELEDLKIELYKKMALAVEKISTFNNLLEILEQKKLNLEMLADYYEKSISVREVFKTSVELSKKIFSVEDNILDIKDKLKSVKNEFKYLTNEDFDSVQTAVISQDFFQDDIKKSPKYRIFEIKTKRLELQSKLEERQKYSNVKLNVSYNNRQNFDDYLSFSTSFALPIYGSEDAKAKKAKYLSAENSKKESDFLQNRVMIFNTTYERIGYLRKRVENLDALIERYTKLNEYDKSNIINSVTLDKNIQNENLLLDLKIQKLKYNLDIKTAYLELFYITKESI